MYHHRRKSGHGSANNSTTDVRKAVTASDPAKYKRPIMTRRNTPVNAQKLGRSQRERERDRHESWDDERESFPQFCMTCEKQFAARDDRHLYCSETCRRTDQNSSTQGVSMRHYNGSNYVVYPGNSSEPRDIVPRASPSRPNSMLYSNSPPATPGTTNQGYHHTSAISALRSLNVRPPSPPSPTGSGGSIWPFSRSAATSPSTSYTRPSAGFFSSTYDTGYGGSGAYNAYSYDVGSGGMERPLPSRHPGSSRPKSIELVTPMIGR